MFTYNNFRYYGPFSSDIFDSIVKISFGPTLDTGVDFQRHLAFIR